jgi:hypothetical protein
MEIFIRDAPGIGFNAQKSSACLGVSFTEADLTFADGGAHAL